VRANSREENCVAVLKKCDTRCRYETPVTSAGVVKSMQQKLHRLNVRIGSRLQAMKDLGVQQPQLVRTKELLQLTEFEEQVH
jgi:hypothetical protein